MYHSWQSADEQAMEDWDRIIPMLQRIRVDV